MNYRTFSYRFADQVLNSNLRTRSEVEDIVREVQLPEGEYKRIALNSAFRDSFAGRGWSEQSRLFENGDAEDGEDVPFSKLDFLKNRVGVEVAFSHASFIGIDLLKFQMMSYASLDKIDVGVYIVVTNALHRATGKAFDGSVTYEKVVRYLPHFKSAIQVPVLVIGLQP